MKKVLIVDDDQVLAETWMMGLKSAGFDVITAVNGNDGISKTVAHKPDVIILDQIMPDMQGNQVLATLKRDPQTHRVPVILVSNYNQPEVMIEAMQHGAVDYLLKYETEIGHLVERINAVVV